MRRALVYITVDAYTAGRLQGLATLLGVESDEVLRTLSYTDLAGLMSATANRTAGERIKDEGETEKESGEAAETAGP